MENPLTEEQIKKLNEIAKLPRDKQQSELQSFLKTLSKEQYEYLLKQQQGGNGEGSSCPFCSIGQGKIPAKVIYEDNEMMAFLDINPANKGHTLIIPKEHFEVSTQMPDKLAERMFLLANKISKKLYDTLEAAGTNIYLANGAMAGQNAPHVLLHVIPRYKDDGLSLTWQGKKADEKELEKIRNDLKGITMEDKVVKQEVPEEIQDDDFDEYTP